MFFVIIFYYQFTTIVNNACDVLQEITCIYPAFSSSAVSILAFIFTCALDVCKCLALASLFVCGQLHGRVRHAMRGCNYVAKVPRSKKITANAVIFVVRPQGLVESQRLS